MTSNFEKEKILGVPTHLSSARTVSTSTMDTFGRKKTCPKKMKTHLKVHIENMCATLPPIDVTSII